ncbi:MAG: Holliday junction branch migration protein RuvA [Patescibacteria group bacterium]
MIAYLAGTVIHKDLKYLVIDTGGIGYKVSAPIDQMKAAKEGEKTQFWIYTVVREDALDLYGFADKETLKFFELLITISGIGPKSALGILSAAPLSSLREAVVTGETAYLTKIGGIGKKIADKIVLELKGKVVFSADETISSANSLGRGDMDALEALKSLGYTQKEARDALEGLDKKITDTGAKVKAALRILGS